MSFLGDIVSRYLPPPTFREGEAVSASKLNAALAGLVRRISVGPGLRKVESPDGSAVAISLVPQTAAIEVLLWAEVTDSQAVSGGGSSGYKYAWSEVERTEYGFQAVDSPRTGTFASGGTDYALSLAEVNGDSAGPIETGKYVLIRVTSRDDGSPAYTIVQAGGGGPAAKWGKVTSYAPGSNSVTLQPCAADGTDTADPTVTVFVTLPVSRPNCSFAMILAGDVLAYTELDGVRWLASVPLPYSTDTGKVYQITATSGTGGFDNVRMR